MNNITYKILRHRLKVRKSEKYLRWFRLNKGEPHHILQSQTGIKLNDFLCVARTRAVHEKEHRSPTDFNIILSEAIENLLDYLEELQ